MDYRLYIVGAGPGDAAYLTPAASAQISAAAVLVGGGRLLQPFIRPGVKTKNVDGDLNSVVEFIQAELAGSDVTVLVSGDPGFYSLLPLLRRHFADRITVIPGISSIQLAFARAGLPWQNALLTSVHGRTEQPEIWGWREGKLIGLLTDGEHDSAYVAGRLTAAGWPPQTRVWLCSRLSYPDETVETFSLAELADKRGTGHCVMIIAG
ncbi:MAG: precorrin-6y C5,15-methyltransferase (decarboxylating) subunit CbiE [Sporomusaceae bacterium]|nr:precorrin-6y C5,15-methyltransferase (decarboxylating) subunit CbiE [Sporomusaceae bacterium]